MTDIRIWKQLVGTGGIVVAAAAFMSMCARVNTVTSQVETKPHSESTYVTKTDFVVWQSGIAVQHVKDSLAADYRFTRIDSLLSQLVRACHRQGQCQ